ncbi:CRISPR-associated protein [Pyrobaculum neutrophilum]|uniref:CRISPR-associated RAMP protein, Csm5 family n=1 Tax=Pyrobaculum neutrophilum (strain DSM 2338 / JCM 9278 / NBRC 100436 / V24Sta) TaxID=444157 RepID=B1Y8K2_PYRNV|nr:CRISPR-associated protein [Pyrobaculum neutrophilum]ACB40081.1 CRISPR-associated RAMP protein, Csm5 family [Pyrobaculum neutrophilum V24Sta]
MSRLSAAGGPLAGWETAVLRLRAETPVFVLSGRAAVVGLDALWSGGRLHVLDLEHPALLRLIEAQVRAGRAPSLADVVAAARADPARYSRLSLPSPQLPDKAEVKLGIPPPASTVKGMLRTAYLHWVLKRDGEARGRFLSAVAQALEERVHPKFLAARGEAAVFKVVVGKRVWDVFNAVLVREGPAGARFEVYKIDVVKGSNVIASAYAVGASPGSAFEYRVVVRPRPREDGGGDAVLALDDLKKALDDFAREAGEREGWRPRCPAAVRIGFGAGRRWKTVLNLVERHDPALYRRIQEYMTQRLKRFWGDVTKKTVEGMPVGWACYEWL